jgi:hypothetical protein
VSGISSDKIVDEIVTLSELQQRLCPGDFMTPWMLSHELTKERRFPWQPKTSSELAKELGVRGENKICVMNFIDALPAGSCSVGKHQKIVIDPNYAEVVNKWAKQYLSDQEDYQVWSETPTKRTPYLLATETIGCIEMESNGENPYELLRKMLAA